jgi:hypothetical protein
VEHVKGAWEKGKQVAEAVGKMAKDFATPGFKPATPVCPKQAASTIGRGVLNDLGIGQILDALHQAVWSQTASERGEGVGRALFRIGQMMAMFYVMRGGGGEGEGFPQTDATGKWHCKLESIPKKVPKEWSVDDLLYARDQLKKSIGNRKKSAIDSEDMFLEDPGHLQRIQAEMNLLSKIEQQLKSLGF